MKEYINTYADHADMRFVRLFGIVIIFYGLSYAQFALVQIVDTLRTGDSTNVNWYIVATNLNIGLTIFVIGVGLMLAKEWARKLWLMTCLALLMVHIFFLWVVYTYGENHTRQLLNTLLIVILLIISMTRLLRPEIKELFH